MRVDATDKAVEYIVEHGGKLYVWADESEIGHASVSPPKAHVDWAEYPVGPFTLFQDASIIAPDWWRVELHHLPLRHLTAIWDGGIFGAVGPPDFEDVWDEGEETPAKPS